LGLIHVHDGPPLHKASALFTHWWIEVKGAHNTVKTSAEISLTGHLKTLQISRPDPVSRRWPG
jgi:hypothetical protein